MTSQELINIGALLMQSQHNQVDQSLKKTIPQRKNLETDESSRIFIQDMLNSSITMTIRLRKRKFGRILQTINNLFKVCL